MYLLKQDSMNLIYFKFQHYHAFPLRSLLVLRDLGPLLVEKILEKRSKIKKKSEQVWFCLLAPHFIASSYWAYYTAWWFISHVAGSMSYSNVIHLRGVPLFWCLRQFRIWSWNQIWSKFINSKLISNNFFKN